ncbi:MAG: Holliday junction branch migration protein RuvA [Sterolibacteriaceae bacterium]|jgi:Holliday junction DNA helicase RuvA|nr:Holliday junction branch migration protein RuvA [Candidatus Methylophosphatis haderslevensis]
MIGRLTGTLLEKNPPQITLDVHGVGYELEVPMSTFYNLPDAGGKLSLFTHLVVREDGHFLFGFGSEAERAAFRQLIRITGVGPRIALALLSGLSVGELAQAVAMQETGRLTRVPGIGKKTAERLLLELRDKLPRSSAIASAAAPPSEGADVLNALLALGYSEKEALAAIRQLAPDVGVSDGIRAALKLLSRV